MKKTYELDEKIEFPNSIHAVTTEKGTLFVARNEPTWMLVNDDEKEILSDLLEGKTPRETIHHISRHNNPERTIKNLEKTLKKILLSEFYQKEESIQKENIPFHIYITNECNFSCKHCYKNAKKQKKRRTDRKRTQRYR